MRTPLVIFAAVAVLAATPALAGTLTFDNGQTAWHSTQCVKPNPPASLLAANPDTAGDDMNGLMGQYNAYVAAAQNYMDCVSREAAHDQAAADQAIVASAQETIATMKGEVDASAKAMRGHND